MIYVGIDDTDTIDTRGTNQLARALARIVRAELRCRRITRHQLLDDPRVPYTSKNGSASLVFEPLGPVDLAQLAGTCADVMRGEYIVGSDPGLCVTGDVPEAVRRFGRRCQSAVVTQAEARTIAAAAGLFLLGIGGTQDGVIGALAAVGLAADDNDGRVIQWGDWSDDLSGQQAIASLGERGVTVRDLDTCQVVERGTVDIGKKLRPNWRQGGCVLYVRRCSGWDGDANHFQAVKLP